VSSSSIYCPGRPDFSWIPSKFCLPATASNRVEGCPINFAAAAAAAVFPASDDSITFYSVLTTLSIPSIYEAGIGGSGLPCVVEAVEVISTVLFSVFVVTAVTLGGRFWFESQYTFSRPRRLETPFAVISSWLFSPLGGKLSFRGVCIILFLLGLGQVQLTLEGETFVDPFVELLQSGTFFTFRYF
jgi:hypothetical protein